MSFDAAWAAARQQVDRALAEALEGEEPALRAALAGALDGGKRARPALLLLVHEALGAPGPARAERYALAVEMVHAATLVHDDLVDGDAVRRGRPALHVALQAGAAGRGARGPALAVLAGDAALAWALERLDAPALARVGPALRATWRGAWDEALGQADAVAVARGKTGALFRLAGELGALAAHAPEAALARAGAYGEAVGVAYQLADDLADGAPLAARPGLRSQLEAEAAQARLLAASLPPGAARRALEEAPLRLARAALAPPRGAGP